MRRKKSAQSHAKDSNGAESDEGDDDDEEDEDEKPAEQEKAEQDVNASEQMDLENKENEPSSTEERSEIPGVANSHNGHVSSAEGDCTESFADGIRNGKSSPGIQDGESVNSAEVQPTEHTDDKRVEPSAEEDAGTGKSNHILGK